MEAGLRDVHERVAVLEAEHRSLRQEITALVVTIDGPPRVDSVRGRLHTLEASNAASAVAAKALAEARSEHRQARSERERAEGARWSWRWKLLAAATSVALAVAPYVTLIYGR